MNFEFDNNIPIYIQLVEQLKKHIISGKMKCGDRLPSVRELAFETKVNPNTMQRALVELEEMKLVYTERTNGKFVTNDQELINKFKDQYAKDISKKYFASMKELGLEEKEIINYLKEIGGNK